MGLFKLDHGEYMLKNPRLPTLMWRAERLLKIRGPRLRNTRIRSTYRTQSAARTAPLLSACVIIQFRELPMSGNKIQFASAALNSYLTVTGVARAAGVDAHVVRFYARSGLIYPTRVGANGYRQFEPLDVKRVRFIRIAQSLGFTLAEIHEILKRSRRGRTPCPLAREIIERRLAETRDRLKQLAALQKRMQRASAAWRGMADMAPNGDVICALIEAVGGPPNMPATPR